MLTTLVLHAMLYWSAVLVIWPRGDHPSFQWSNVGNVLFNQGVVNPIVFWIWDSLRPTPVDDPEWWTMIAVILLEELGFYWTHRLLHTPNFYFYHKSHHKWTNTLPFSALDCHPFEHVLSNLGPLILGPALFRWPLTWVALWFSVATINTVWAHRYGAFDSHHSLHHLKQKGNYGISPFTDGMFGTLIQ